MLVYKTISGGMSGNGGAPTRNPMGHTNVLIRARQTARCMERHW